MKLYYIIDLNGYLIDIVFLTNRVNFDYTNYIEVEPIGFQKPKWNGSEWIEG